VTKIKIEHYDLQVPTIVVRGFNDLGLAITNEFKALLATFFTAATFELSPSFQTESAKLFSVIEPSQKVKVCDAYFNNFTGITQRLMVELHQYGAASAVWRKVLEFVNAWEHQNPSKRLHKGTPYYFWSVAAALQEDIDTAMMAMHNALEEDKENLQDFRSAPAYYFLTVNEAEGAQYFKVFVDAMAAFIKTRLDAYRGDRKGAIDYQRFRGKFLDSADADMEDLKYFFVYAVLRLWRLAALREAGVGDDRMAPLIFTSSLMPLLLVADNLCSRWSGKTYMSDHAYELAKKRGSVAPSTTAKQYKDDLDIDGRRNSDFARWLQDLKTGQYSTKSGRSVSGLEADFAMAWGLRNFSAHTVRSQDVLWESYADVLQSVFNSVFLAVEML
jgi:hypothetical protein